MKEPLNGNLALNFLFKNQDIGDLIKQKNIEIQGQGSRSTVLLPQTQPIEPSSPCFSKLNRSVMKESILDISATEQSSVVDPFLIPGYYTSKSKKKIGNINDFINNARKLNALPEFCKQEDQDFAGIKKFFTNFMLKIKHKLAESPLLSKDI